MIALPVCPATMQTSTIMNREAFSQQYHQYLLAHGYQDILTTARLRAQAADVGIIAQHLVEVLGDGSNRCAVVRSTRG
jgi:hypothetical protein